MPLTFCAKRFVRNVLGETFWTVFFLEPHFASGAGCWAGPAALGWAGLGWAGLIKNEAEIGLFENGKVCIHRKNELPHVQHLFLS